MRVMSTIITAALLISITACNNSSKTDEDKTDTIVVIQKEEPANNPAPVVTPPVQVPVEPVADWRTMMNEYHDILCRAHKNTSQANDKIRQAELLVQLNHAKQNLDKTEKIFYATEMARTVNMKSCN